MSNFYDFLIISNFIVYEKLIQYSRFCDLYEKFDPC